MNTRRLRYGVPLLILVLLLGLLGYGLRLDPQHVPSPLVGQQLPSFALPQLEDPAARFAAEAPFLLNIWASWCVSCRQEHPLLLELSQELPVYGLNYRDARPAAEAWLARWGNPYIASAYDPEGRMGLTLGVYAVPETFLIDAAGVVRYKHTGPLTREALDILRAAW